MLLRLAAQAEHRANLKATHLRKLRADSLADQDSLASRAWRWLLVRCGIRRALASLDRVERCDLFLSGSLLRLTARILSRDKDFYGK